MQFSTITALVFAAVAVATTVPDHETHPVDTIIDYAKTCKVTDVASFEMCIRNSPLQFGGEHKLPFMPSYTKLGKRAEYYSAQECWDRANDQQRAAMILNPFSCLSICRKS